MCNLLTLMINNSYKQEIDDPVTEIIQRYVIKSGINETVMIKMTKINVLGKGM